MSQETQILIPDIVDSGTDDNQNVLAERWLSLEAAPLSMGQFYTVTLPLGHSYQANLWNACLFAPTWIVISDDPDDYLSPLNYLTVHRPAPEASKAGFDALQNAVHDFREDADSEANRHSVFAATQFLSNLPTYYDIPDVVLDQDGYVTMEWTSGTRSFVLWFQPDAFVYSLIDTASGKRHRGETDLNDTSTIFHHLRTM